MSQWTLSSMLRGLSPLFSEFFCVCLSLCFVYLVFDPCELIHLECFCFRNIVSTVNLDCKLDLKAIALQARNAEYNPKVFALL